MKVILKILLVFLLVAVAATPLLLSADHPSFLENFEFAGRGYSLNAVFSPGQADLTLSDGRSTVNLSAGMRGENILLGVRHGSDNFYIFWVNYNRKALRLAYFDHRQGRACRLPLSDFAAIGFPEIIEQGGMPRALLFLADRTGNDVLFHYELASGALTPLTETPFCEKRFTWKETDGCLEIKTDHLRGQRRYRFDPRLGVSELLEEMELPVRMKATASAPPPEYYNTYIGFGDSITWGKIEGVQRLDLCFLTQMRDTYLAADYGPADFINLGIPALGTYEAALRVDQDLDNYSAFYFLLMLGVNDVQSSDFSLASRMEDMEYIIDAALARHMRVIVSTLTPRKDEKANLQWFWDNLNNFSSAILQLAAEKGVARIDTLSAFMNTAPPDGWKMLLEQIIPGVSKGNHPNGEGHKLIATLFSEALIAFPPLPPQSITVIDPDNNRQRTALWKANYESDFSHFHIEFDFLPQKFEYALDITTAYHTFILFPFLPQLYFRVQTFDRGNRQSIFSTLESADAPTQLKLSKKSRPGR